MAAITSAVIAGGAAAYGVNQQGKAAKSAAAAQSAASDAAIAEQRRQFDTVQANNQPWMQAGQGALNQLSRLYGIGVPGENVGPGGTGTNAPDYSAFYNSPDYQFALQQGEQANQRQASAAGNLYSGNTLAAAQRYGQGLATQNYGNYVNQLSGLAGIGQNATQQTNQAAFNTGQGVSDSLVGQGAARASGLIGSGNAAGGLAGIVGGTANSVLGSNTFQNWWGAPTVKSASSYAAPSYSLSGLAARGNYGY